MMDDIIIIENILKKNIINIILLNIQQIIITNMILQYFELKLFTACNVIVTVLIKIIPSIILLKILLVTMRKICCLKNDFPSSNSFATLAAILL